ncbi:MAG: hypothetical protein ABIS46_06095 [Sphingomicrobium sp.]
MNGVKVQGVIGAFDNVAVELRRWRQPVVLQTRHFDHCAVRMASRLCPGRA